MRCALMILLGALFAQSANLHKTKAFDLFSKNKWAEGIEELDRGYAISKSTGFLYNKAVAYERWPGHCKEAIAAYETFLEACGRCGQHLVAKDRLALVKLACSPPAERRPELPKEQIVEGWADL